MTFLPLSHNGVRLEGLRVGVNHMQQRSNIVLSEKVFQKDFLECITCNLISQSLFFIWICYYLKSYKADVKCALSSWMENTERAGGKVGFVRKPKERRWLTELTWLISLLCFLTQTDLIETSDSSPLALWLSSLCLYVFFILFVFNHGVCAFSCITSICLSSL